MDHSIAIEALKDELDEAKVNAQYLSKGIAAMMIRKFSGSEKIREDAILRWRSKLAVQQERVHSLRRSIKFLEHHSIGGK